MSGAGAGGAVPVAPGGAPRRRSWPRTTLRLLGDAALIAACLAAGLALLGWEIETPAAQRSRSDVVVFLDLLLGAPACSLLLARRRWPVVVASVLALLSVLSVFAGLVCVVALFSVAVRCRRRTVAVVGALTWAATVTQAVLWPDPEVPAWMVALLVPLVLLPVVGWGMYVRARRQLLASLRQEAVRARAEQELRAEQARAAERARIAREMHDVLAHRLSLVSMHAGALEFRPDAPAEDVARAAGVIRAGTHEALEDLRGILGVLRAGDATGSGVVPEEVSGRPQPVLTDLPELVAQAREGGTAVDLEVDVPQDVQVPALVGRTAYRVVQEGLTNARKHAPGHEVRVRVRGGPGHGVEVAVLDGPRPGGAPSAAATSVPGSGLGLVGLAERVALAGGHLEHDRDGAGFRLRARLPWRA